MIPGSLGTPAEEIDQFTPGRRQIAAEYASRVMKNALEISSARTNLTHSPNDPKLQSELMLAVARRDATNHARAIDEAALTGQPLPPAPDVSPELQSVADAHRPSAAA